MYHFSKIIKPCIIIFLIFFSNLYAYDLSNKIDLPLSQQETNTTNISTERPKKVSESFYKKFENFFSDYNDNWVENMFTYTADMMMPDEMMMATKEVIKNRIDKKFDSSIEHLPKILGNDAYNFLLITTYYHMQDMSRITDELWEEDACDPDTFEYNISKEPKEPLLHLKANHKDARGVTENGIVLPINLNFPDAFYPYAAKPDGCSAEGLQDVYNDANKFFDDDRWIKEACNAHDRCYFTQGSTSKECNAQFIVDAVDSCNNISGLQTVLFMGSRNAVGGIKALSVTTVANACAEKYFLQSQKKQKAYNQWVSRYEQAYSRAEK